MYSGYFPLSKCRWSLLRADGIALLFLFFLSCTVWRWGWSTVWFDEQTKIVFNRNVSVFNGKALLGYLFRRPVAIVAVEEQPKWECKKTVYILHKLLYISYTNVMYSGSIDNQKLFCFIIVVFLIKYLRFWFISEYEVDILTLNHRFLH